MQPKPSESKPTTEKEEMMNQIKPDDSLKESASSTKTFQFTPAPPSIPNPRKTEQVLTPHPPSSPRKPPTLLVTPPNVTNYSLQNALPASLPPPPKVTTSSVTTISSLPSLPNKKEETKPTKAEKGSEDDLEEEIQEGENNESGGEVEYQEELYYVDEEGNEIPPGLNTFFIVTSR